MIGQPKWNFMMSELPLPHKLKKWNKRKMKWGEEGLNGGFLMGKAKLRLIYAAWSPVPPPISPFGRKNGKVIVGIFWRNASNGYLLTEINHCLSFIHTEHAPPAQQSPTLSFVTFSLPSKKGGGGVGVGCSLHFLEACPNSSSEVTWYWLISNLCRGNYNPALEVPIVHSSTRTYTQPLLKNDGSTKQSGCMREWFIFHPGHTVEFLKMVLISLPPNPNCSLHTD